MASPSSKQIGIKGKVIHAQGREIIANVMKFMKEEAKNGKPTIPLANYRERVVAATKISEKTYRRISQESAAVDSGACASFTTPHKDRPRRSPKSTVSVGEMETIRSIIRELYTVDKKTPTLKGILEKIRSSGVPFKGGLTTLSIVLKNMGFQWKKTADNRKIWVESLDPDNDLNFTRFEQSSQHPNFDFIPVKEEPIND